MQNQSGRYFFKKNVKLWLGFREAKPNVTISKQNKVHFKL